MAMPEPTITITDEQIAFYHREGYLNIERITTDEEIERLVKIYDRLFEQRVGREQGMQFDLAGADEEGKEAALPQILGPSNFAPELKETLYAANARAIASQLYGVEVGLGGDHAIFKPARHGAPTPWHQDEAYWDPGTLYNSLSVWMPLQPATLENGCMQFIPRSHEWEVLPHRSIGNDPRIHGLELAVEIDLSSAIACPLPAAGATFHHSRTLHYTGPNHSDMPRRAYILGFGVAGKKLDTPRDFAWQREKRTARAERAHAAREKAAA
jgi:ectoine hydroxylase-related dioxygenase (phytanoyl-CoA dioxygenase family)